MGNTYVRIYIYIYISSVRPFYSSSSMFKGKVGTSSYVDCVRRCCWKFRHLRPLVACTSVILYNFHLSEHNIFYHNVANLHNCFVVHMYIVRTYICTYVHCMDCSEATGTRAIGRACCMMN